ncbi:hypothetical protein LCGC14_0616090 [marine sediment metagenome]|jgi:hypothetical protein|uniref:Uncharacterized protein n=1 Tax=marine sediment metagenome TaxID=412755 RepID=A0A0F9R675_9ZZZZ|nr:hypothetical protein [archaeon]HEC40871.1 hypothetical protein [bacterium]
MSVVRTVKSNDVIIQKFIDWDKFENVFYNNFYLENFKIVVKVPLFPNLDPKEDLKIKKFNLEKYTFLISYD